MNSWTKNYAQTGNQMDWTQNKENQYFPCPNFTKNEPQEEVIDIFKKAE